MLPLETNLSQKYIYRGDDKLSKIRLVTKLLLGLSSIFLRSKSAKDRFEDKI